MSTAEVPIHKVDIGSEVQSGENTYRLLRISSGSAYVQLVTNERRRIKRGNETLAEFDAPGRRIHISPNTMIHVLRTPAEIEWEEPPTSTSAGTKKSNGRRRRGKGKPAEPKMRRLIDPKKKIGRVVQWLLEEPPRDVNTLAKKFEITRACALSYLFCIHRDYGVGYIMDGDMVKLDLPVDVTDPFKKEEK